MTRASDMFSALIVICAVVARAKSEYNYQHPSSSFELPAPQYPQGFRSTAQQSYAYAGTASYAATHGSQQGHSKHQHISPQPNHNNYYQGANFNNAVSQNVQQTHSNSVNQNSIIAAPVQPIVTKHIYFHVAPPDVEASVSLTPIKRKKTYNIVFIKVPSQRQKFYINSQGFLTNPYAPVEDKTLIYVLVKNPDGQGSADVRSPPNHEVYYVKYKSNAGSVGSQISSGVSEVSQSQVTAVRSLGAGLINGQN